MATYTKAELIKASGILRGIREAFDDPDHFRPEFDWAERVAEAMGWSIPKGVPSEDEIRANGHGGRQPKSRPTSDAVPDDPPRPEVVRLADVAPQELRPLWDRWLYLGKIALLIGDPGMAKTMLSLTIAAAVTTGGLFPDGSRAPLGDVVILTAEDGLADTIRPRLDRAGADVSRVWAVRAMRQDGRPERMFSLRDDVDALEDVVREKSARLVVIDPLDAYLAGIDSHRNADVRAVLAPWARMLEETGAGGLGVHHLNKDAATANALYRAGGSLAYVAAARSVFGVVNDPDEEGRRLLLSVKLNVAAKPDGLGYRVTERGIEWDGRPVTVDAAAAFSPARRADSDLVTTAKDYLLEALGEGVPQPQIVVEQEAARRGISRKSLQVAKKALNVQSKREGFGRGGIWYWFLPLPNRE